MSNIKTTYQDLISSSLYKEAFLLLKEKVKTLHPIETGVEVDNFLKVYLNEDNLENAKKSSYLIPYINNFLFGVKENSLFVDFFEKIPLLLDQKTNYMVFKDLVLANENESAIFFKDIMKLNSNINHINHYDLMFELSLKDNLNAVKFICEEMDNIHFQRGALLRVLSKRDVSILNLLLSQYNFDINKSSDITSLNLLSSIVRDKDAKKFAYVANQYANEIDWNHLYYIDVEDINTKEIINTNAKKVDIFTLIKTSDKSIDFLGELLKDETLNRGLVTKIAHILLEDANVRSLAAKTDIFKTLFNHNNFFNIDYAKGKTHFLYILMGKMGNAMFYEKDDVAKEYGVILKDYIEEFNESLLPKGKNTHALGALISILTEIRSKKEITEKSKEILLQCMNSIAEKEPDLVNTKNPNGKYPVIMNNDKDIYQVLLNHGAVPKNSEKGFFNALKIFFNFYTPTVDEKLIEEYFSKKQNEERMKNEVNHESIQDEIVYKFNPILDLLSNSNISDEIKSSVLDIFNMAENLGKKLDESNLNLMKEKHFLTENVAFYTKRSINIYIDTCELNKRFSEITNSANNVDAQNKCLEQLSSLHQNLSKINKNIYSQMREQLNTNAQVHSSVLQTKSEEIIELEINGEPEEFIKKKSIQSMDDGFDLDISNVEEYEHYENSKKAKLN